MMVRRSVLFGGALALALVVWWVSRPPPLPGPPPSTPIPSVPPPQSAEALRLPTLAPMLRRVMPAVVSVYAQGLAPADSDSLMQDEGSGSQGSDDAEPRARRVLGAGSGVIIDASRGLILTNDHVVKSADRIAVALADGRRVAARLVGADEQTDIALLRIAAPGLIAMPLGNSDALEIGDYVVAIGNPFGLGETATLGIVSALGRAGLGIERYEDFIQTDAAINPGNSGGALVDFDGRLVGINAAIVGGGSRGTGGNVGIGFAIPINMARAVADQLVRYGAVARGLLGVVAEDHPAAMPVSFQAQTPQGAMVTVVARGSPAEQAGIRRGDLILAINRERLESAAQLRTRVSLLRPGTTVAIKLLRGGKPLMVTAVLAAAEGRSR